MLKVYLSGGHRSGWQNKLISEMPNIHFFNPSEHELEKPILYTAWDTYHVQKCDILFAYMEESNPSGLGLIYEVGIAKGLNKLIILVDEKSGKDVKFGKYFSIVRNGSTVVFDNLASGVSFLKTFTKNRL